MLSTPRHELQYGNGRLWYAIHVRSRFEFVAAETLVGKGYEAFLPTCRSSRQWSDRSKELDQPLFPGYLFCRFDVQDRLLPILTTPGVISILGAGKAPVAVPGPEIDAIQVVIQSGLPAQPWPGLAPGCKVSIERGPLAGIEGIVLKSENPNAGEKDRLIVSVQLLQRSVAVKIQREWISRSQADNGRPVAKLRSATRDTFELRPTGSM